MRNEFDRMPDELIVHIFSYTNFKCLGRLASTCRRFKVMINRDEFVWKPMAEKLLGSNLKSPFMRLRCRPLLTMQDRCRVSRNWENCKYTAKVIRKYQRSMPCVQLDRNFLYSSDRSRLHRFKRNYDGSVIPTEINDARSHMSDICKFVLNGSEVISGARDGSIVRRDRSDFSRIAWIACHKSELMSLDAKDDIIITGDKEGWIKMWKTIERSTKFVEKCFVGNRVLSLSVMPSKQNFICGLPGTNKIPPLTLYDVQCCKPIRSFGKTFRNGAGILDVFPECQNTFLCSSYDTTVRLWDIRTPDACVARWEDPYDNTIYTVKSDYIHTIVTGANRNSVVQIWDKRMRRVKHILYTDHYNSPTYSVAFDGSYIYAAFDRGMMELCFLGDLFG